MKRIINSISLMIACLSLSSTYAQNICNAPNSVDQSVWRAGMDLPIPGRVASKTTHIVIHHSADPNIETSDYSSIVRTIYDFHTKSNGWDDIGYNYLIDPNGVIYKGRDPENFEQDEVQGAHMCNKNENTMGICMIGTFTNVLPTKAALKSLYLLAGWKIAKDKINPFGESMHGIGPSSSNLPAAMLANVCGHRDGCQSGYTECPGTSFYNTLGLVRDSISYFSSKCTITGIAEKELKEFKLLTLKNNIFMIPKDDFETVVIFNSLGQIVLDRSFDIDLADAIIPSNNILFVSLQNSNGKNYKLKVKLD